MVVVEEGLKFGERVAGVGGGDAVSNEGDGVALGVYSGA